MKKQFQLLAVMIGISFHYAAAQGSNPCNMQWGPLETVLSNNMGSVSIRIQSSSCNKTGGICGWPKIAILHTFSEQSVLVSVDLKGTDCDGTQHVSGFTSNNQANIEDRSQGNWHTFKSVQGVVSVRVSFKKGNDSYEIILDKAKGVNRTLKNNSPLMLNGKTEDEMAKEKQQQEEEKEKATKAAENKKKEDDDKKQSAKEEAERKKEESQRRTAADNAEQKRQDEEREAKRIADSASWAQRNERVNNIQQQEAANATMVTQMSTGVIGLMFNENLQDRDFERRFMGVKALTGIGIENFPAIENFISGSNPKLNSSSLTSNLPITVTGGLQFSFFNKKYWRLYTVPEAQFGVSYGGGSIGYYYSYGIKAGLSIGNKVRFEMDGGYYQLDVTQQTDADAANQEIGIVTNTNDQYYSNFKHYVIRGAAGISFRFKEDYTQDKQKPRMGYFYIGAFADRPQYFEQASNAPVPGLEIRYKSPGGFYMKGMYASNYPFSGDAAYAIDERKNGTYFSVTFGKIFSLSK